MTKTHWKKLCNPDYLGAYALEPGKDMVLTIKTVGREMVTGTDGRKEERTVAHFIENVKPMVINRTNAKTIEKLTKSPYIEDWPGARIQIYADNVKAFGETVEGLRIRPFPPRIQGGNLKCADCGETIKASEKMTAEQIAAYTTRRYGRAICTVCAHNLEDTKQENGEGDSDDSDE